MFSLLRGPIWRVTEYAFFNYLADAFLHGQIALRLLPSNLHDLVLHQGQYYLYWPPFPALLFMPFIAIFGVQFSDVFFTLILASINVGLVRYFLRKLDEKNIAPLPPYQQGLLTLFFAFGTVHLLVAPFGRVWFTSQVVAFLCSILAYLAAICLRGRKAFLFSGAALACAMLTRSHLILLGIWIAYYLVAEYKHLGWRKLALYGLNFIVPILLGLLVYFSYNHVRFGNIFEVGTSYQDLGPFFQADFEKYGVFNLHYIPINFYYNFIYYPLPFSEESLLGGSLFLLSPVFLAALTALYSARPRVSVFFLGLTIAGALIPILVVIGTGWITFGPRYTLDFTPPLLLLTALGLRNWSSRWLTLLAIISILHYTIGVIAFSAFY
ncbi:MAG: hypothetical protein HY865_23850 [Chloroflexi bacterium]|nr:hypothetical protein [Chloroflexota bacterium]